MAATQQPQAIVNWRAPGFEELLAILQRSHAPLYVVGGSVRDALLGRSRLSPDLDLALASPVIPLARQAADRLGWAFYPLDVERDVARLVQPLPNGRQRICDLAGLRGSITHDLATRDFSVNAMALRLQPDSPPVLLDPYGGMIDLAARRLRTVGADSFDSDPVRLLRAVRFAVELDFSIDAETRRAIADRAHLLHDISPERVRDTLWKSVLQQQPSAAIQMLHELSLLEPVLPELAATLGVQQTPPHHLEVFAHSLLAADHAARLRAWLLQPPPASGPDSHVLDADLVQLLISHRAELHKHFSQVLADSRSRADWLVWNALLHDVGKAQTGREGLEDGEVRIRFHGHEGASAALVKSRLDALRFARREIELATAAAANHMRPHHLHASFSGGSLSHRAAYRFFRDLGASGLDVVLLALVDRQSIGTERSERWRAYLRTADALLAFAARTRQQLAAPLLRGRDLIETFDLAPGPQIGALLDAINEARASGEIDSREQALHMVAQQLGTGFQAVRS